MSHHRRRMAAGSVPLLAFLALAAAPGPAGAQAPSLVLPAQTQVEAGAVTFALGAGVGQVGGTAHERVYAPWARDFKVSELKWDIENVALAGIQATADVGGRLRLTVSYWGAVSEGSGGMVDRDWLLLDSDSDDDWTHESRHPDTSVDSGSLFDMSLDAGTPARGPLSLRGILGYRITTWEWSSRGGDYIYTWDRNDDGLITADEFRTYRGSFPEGQLVIEYRQEYSMPYLGIGLEGAWSFVRVRGQLLYSPWVSAEDHDYHVLRDTTFDGDFSGGDWLSAGISACWLFLPRWYATAGVEYQKFAELIGNVTVTEPEGRWKYRNGGGVELEMVLLQLAAGFRF